MQVSYFRIIISCYSIMVSTARILAIGSSASVFAIMDVAQIK